MKIGIIDYGVGNLASVYNAFTYLGYEAQFCANPALVEGCERLVLPGVGSFRSGMRSLETQGWVDVLKSYVLSGRPLLGICLGMQLLFDRGEERGPTSGLGMIPGEVLRLLPREPHKVPHMGWNSLVRIVGHPLLIGIKLNVDFYFVHSFHCVPADPGNIIGLCDYGGDFVAAVAKNNVAGVQFHPEKSQPAGLRILENFANWDGTC